MSALLINALKAAGKVGFQMVDAGNGKAINLSLSLAGFTAAHGRLLELQQKK